MSEARRERDEQGGFFSWRSSMLIFVFLLVYIDCVIKFMWVMEFFLISTVPTDGKIVWNIAQRLRWRNDVQVDIAELGQTYAGSLLAGFLYNLSGIFFLCFNNRMNCVCFLWRLFKKVCWNQFRSISTIWQNVLLHRPIFCLIKSSYGESIAFIVD